MWSTPVLMTAAAAPAEAASPGRCACFTSATAARATRSEGACGEFSFHFTLRLPIVSDCAETWSIPAQRIAVLYRWESLAFKGEVDTTMAVAATAPDSGVATMSGITPCTELALAPKIVLLVATYELQVGADATCCGRTTWQGATLEPAGTVSVAC